MNIPPPIIIIIIVSPARQRLNPIPPTTLRLCAAAPVKVAMGGLVMDVVPLPLPLPPMAPPVGLMGVFAGGETGEMGETGVVAFLLGKVEAGGGTAAAEEEILIGMGEMGVAEELEEED